jgi:hypothetical protein
VFTHTQRQRLAQRLVSLDRGGRYSIAPSEVRPELFDFQEGAAEWLLGRVQAAEGYSLLEMAAGCGKTRAVGAFLAAARPPDLCLYITQAGLVRQTWSELHQVFPSLACSKAETGKEFARALAHRERIIVTNAAIPKAWLPSARRAWCVIVDEAHRATGPFLARLARYAGASNKLVFVSATPSAGNGLGSLAALAADDQHFVLLKTSAVARSLCMPRLALSESAYASPAIHSDHCAEAFQIVLWYSQSQATPLLIYLCLWRSEPEMLFCEKASEAWARLCATPMSLVQERYLKLRLCHPALHDVAHRLCEARPTSLTEEARDALLALLQTEAPATTVRYHREVCACCGLQEEEIRLLQTALSRALPAPECPAPEDWDLGSSPFVRAVLRLPDARAVLRYKSGAELGAGGTGGFRCHWISSELTAAQRARRVAAFSKAQESPCALALLLKSGFGDSYPACQIKSIGAGEVLRRIVALVADRGLLICDARCGDVGYNLQFSTHILAPSLPRSSEEVQQLCGRAHRIGKRGAPSLPVRIVCCPRRGTGEVFLASHLRHRLGVATAERADSL